ncbi:hypothetical protein [Streptomyces sp. NPDC046821]|uniref:hypothetical protein n=1 Tax=Streptomyces sp. NPDC046821 TaxID=3154702 RepID=UPI0033CFED8F
MDPPGELKPEPVGEPGGDSAADGFAPDAVDEALDEALLDELAAWRAASASTGAARPDASAHIPVTHLTDRDGDDDGQSETDQAGRPVELTRPDEPTRPGNPGPPGAATGPAKTPEDASAGTRRRTGVDPVKALMHRHRDLCERAIDALEIAAGLEAHGVTDRTAARFRHRDVFSLAEEMYARVPRDTEAEPEASRAATDEPSGRRPVWAALALLPGIVCALTLVGLRFTDGKLWLAIGAGGALAVSVALRVALSRGPLHATARTAPATRVWTCWLLAYALLGDGLLNAAIAGGPDGAWAPATAPFLALAFAVAPAAWCARLFSAAARRRLASSRGLEEFAASVRPLLLAVFVLFVGALCTLIAVAGAVLGQSAAYAGAGTLGALLLLARLLTAHGRTHAPAVVLGAAAAAEVLALATVFAGRLPGCGFLAVPVETAVQAWGPGAVPGLTCGVAALALLVHAARNLTRASAHAPTDATQ